MENESYQDDKFREILNNNITSKISSVQRELVEFRSSFQNNAQSIIDSVSLLLNSVEEQVLQDLRVQLSSFETGLRSKLEPELRGRLQNRRHRAAKTRHGRETLIDYLNWIDEAEGARRIVGCSCHRRA